MTTFVLHGGETSSASPDNNLFFKQFTELVDKDEVKVLMCLWSRPKEKWDDLVKRDSQKILEQTNKKVTFDTLERVEEIEDKVTICDVLYVLGGEAELIEPYYDKIKNLKELIDGKVYVGSSMGVFMVSSNYVLSFDSQDELTVHKGLGLLPIQTLCHWDVEEKKKQKLSLLADNDSSMPIVTLDECKFTTLYL